MTIDPQAEAIIAADTEGPRSGLRHIERGLGCDHKVVDVLSDIQSWEGQVVGESPRVTRFVEVDDLVGTGHRIGSVGSPSGRIRDHAFGDIDIRDGTGHPVETHGVSADMATETQRTVGLLPRRIAGGVRYAVAHRRCGINRRAHARRAAIRDPFYLRRISGLVGIVQRRAVGTDQTQKLTILREAERCVQFTVGDSNGRTVCEHHEIAVGRQRRAVRDAPLGEVRCVVAQEPTTEVNRIGTAIMQLNPVAGLARGRQQSAIVIGDKLADRDRRMRRRKH